MAQYLVSDGTGYAGSQAALPLPGRGDETQPLMDEGMRAPLRAHPGKAIKLELVPGHAGWRHLSARSGGMRAPEADFMIAAAHNL